MSKLYIQNDIKMSNLSKKAQSIIQKVNQENIKLGDLRKMAKEIKKDHNLAMELWTTKSFMSRQLSILIMDKKKIDQNLIDQICQDLETHEIKDKQHLTDWFMANQLMKDKKLIALIESWQDSPSSLQRRIFWYYQARLRWTGKAEFENTSDLLKVIETKMKDEVEEVQWAMNFLTGWIGIFDEQYRNQCIEIGEKLGLYKDEKVPKNCTPNYLPEFIRIEIEKRK